MEVTVAFRPRGAIRLGHAIRIRRNRDPLDPIVARVLVTDT